MAKKNQNKSESTQVTNQYYLVSYTTKRGGTGNFVMGFKTEAEAKKLADKACKTVNTTYRYNDRGEKVYALALGVRYADIAVRLCDAMNKGDKAATDKAIAETHEVYNAAVAAGRAESERKKEEKKAQKQTEKLYTAAEVASMLSTLLAGGDVPEDIKKLIKKAA